MLGDSAEPDAEFFVDSWTVGVTAAAENLLHRKEERKIREHDKFAWNTFSSFAPFSFAWEEAFAEPVTQLPEPRSGVADLPAIGGGGSDDWGAVNNAEPAGSLTFESACRLLGVSAASTREQVRAAYRRLASRYHPDRLSRAGAHQLKLASDRMASINEAYRLLCSGPNGRWSACC